MIILGLTGSVAMGKSTVARMFHDFGVPVHDADAAVHALMKGSAFAAIAAAFPAAIKDNRVDRKALGAIVFEDKSGAARKTLEAILHPKIAKHRMGWLAKRRADATRLVVLDIPLLFETGGDRLCDKIAVVSAPEDVQRARALARGMTQTRLHAIRAIQMSDEQKKSRADIIIDTSASLEETAAQVQNIIADLGGANP